MDNLGVADCGIEALWLAVSSNKMSISNIRRTGGPDLRADSSRASRHRRDADAG